MSGRIGLFGGVVGRVLDIADLLREPRPGEGPVSADGAFVDMKDLGDERVGEAGEEAELDDAGGLLVFEREAGEGLIKIDRIEG